MMQQAAKELKQPQQAACEVQRQPAKEMKQQGATCLAGSLLWKLQAGCEMQLA